MFIMQFLHRALFAMKSLPSRNQRAMALAEKLREARDSAKLSQEEAARQLRRPQSYVSRCETGAHRLDVIELQEFARIYKKPLSFFIEPKD